MNQNLEFLNSFINVNKEAFEKLQKISTLKTFEAKKPIAKSGDIASKAYLLTEGLMRAYLSSEDGKEFNKNFFVPFSFVASFTSLISNKPSKLTYETLTECQLYEIDFSEFVNLCEHDLVISNFYNKIMEQVFIAYEERQLELISMNSKERYLKLRKRIPYIDELIPQYQIASYLSITPVQLSRIRKCLK